MLLGMVITVPLLLSVLGGQSAATSCTFGPHCKYKCSQNCRLPIDVETWSFQLDTTVPVCHPSTGYCIYGCQTGWWGGKCQEQCSNHCEKHVCLQTGECISGCTEGYHGLNCNEHCSKNCMYQSCYQNGTCTHGCIHGHYGNDCELSCGISCLNQRCVSDPSRGTYECSDGCVEGWKGSICQQKCPVHCLSCHFLVEGCTSCEPGWTGTDCSIPVRDQCKTLMTEEDNCSGGCHDGFWGPRCQHKCSDFCLRCEQGDGNCTVCHPGRYGVNCESFCTNCEQGLCQIDTGVCTLGEKHEVVDVCKQHVHIHHYNSSHCAKYNRAKRHIVECWDHCKTDDCVECDLGWFGDRCRQFCPQNCFNGCNETTGLCFGCRPDYYGQACDFRCPENCRPDVKGQVACDEVSGHCLSGCVTGWYGWTCNLTCPDHCKGGICTQASGECTQGCSDGFRWNTHFKVCKPLHTLSLLGVSVETDVPIPCQGHTYGKNCENNCSSSCIRSACTYNNTVNRVVCSFGCVDGRFGPYCENKCPPECENCEDYEHCSGCKPGYHGDVCSDPCSLDCNGCGCHQNGSCMDGCIPGHYGPDCTSLCMSNCLKCDQESGKCLTCKSNYCGEKCDKPCYNCHLGISSKEDGNCSLGCNPGFDGPLCNISAHLNTQPCFKFLGSTRSHRSKRHDCRYGCLTSECSQCLDGFYGKICELKCPVNCENKCNRTDGHCDYTCQEGTWGSYCNDSCPTNCRTGCDQSSGSCHGGCKPGWYGSNCTRMCPERCHPNICYQDSGECTKGCIDGWQGITCKLPCSDGCQGRVCHMDGRCKHGCNPNYTGAFGKCSVPCNPQCIDDECSISKNRDRYTCSKGCAEGYSGQFCDIPCDNRCHSCHRYNFKCDKCSCQYYGSDCQHQCNGTCLNTSCPACGNEGVCLHGCRDGHWGDRCLNTCPHLCSRCGITTGRCTKCQPGRYGLQCELECGHCLGQQCHRRYGVCFHGCTEGFRGNMCDIPQTEATPSKVAGSVLLFVAMISFYIFLAMTARMFSCRI